MSGSCEECEERFDRGVWNIVGSTGPPTWAGARLYECPNCGNEQVRPREDFEYTRL